MRAQGILSNSVGSVRRGQDGGFDSLSLAIFLASLSPETVLQAGAWLVHSAPWGKVPREENSCAGCGLNKPFLLWASVFVPARWEVGRDHFQAFSASEVQQI